MKEEIFNYICQRIAWNLYISVIPSTEVAKHFNISLYKARKYIKQLVHDGLLVSDIQVLCPIPHEEEYKPQIFRGYTLTKEGFETDCYQFHYSAMLDFFNDWGNKK